MAELLLYHRTIADRFGMMEGKMTKADVIQNFANRISLMTWAQHRKSRAEAVEFGRGMSEERPPLEMESLENVPINPPDAKPEKKKKRLGII